MRSEVMMLSTTIQWAHSFVPPLPAAPGNLQSPGAVLNGVQATAHQNGVSAKGEAADFEEIIKLKNGSNPTQQQSGLVGEPILAFEGGEPFLMKTSPMKPQHVAGKNKENYSKLRRNKWKCKRKPALSHNIKQNEKRNSGSAPWSSFFLGSHSTCPPGFMEVNWVVFV